MRNVLAYAGKNGRRVVSAFIATAFAQNDAEAARTQWRRVADQLRAKLPKLAAFLDDVLAYMTFPPAHRAKLHSTVARRFHRVPSDIRSKHCGPVIAVMLACALAGYTTPKPPTVWTKPGSTTADLARDKAGCDYEVGKTEVSLPEPRGDEFDRSLQAFGRQQDLKRLGDLCMQSKGYTASSQ